MPLGFTVFFGTSQQWLTPGGDVVASVRANEEIESTENITHDINGAGLAIDVQAWLISLLLISASYFAVTTAFLPKHLQANNTTIPYFALNSS